MPTEAEGRDDAPSRDGRELPRRFRHLWFALLTLAAMSGVAWSLSRKYSLLAAGRGGVPLDRWGERLRGLLVFFIGQKRMFIEPLPGSCTR